MRHQGRLPFHSLITIHIQFMQRPGRTDIPYLAKERTLCIFRDSKHLIKFQTLGEIVRRHRQPPRERRTVSIYQCRRNLQFPKNCVYPFRLPLCLREDRGSLKKALRRRQAITNVAAATISAKIDSSSKITGVIRIRSPFDQLVFLFGKLVQ